MPFVTLSILPGLLLGSPARAQADIWAYAPTESDRAVLQRPDVGFAEGTDQGWIRLHADPEGIHAIEAAGLAWTPAAPLPPSLPAGYHSPAAMREQLAALEQAAPALVTRIQIGHSRRGEPIEAVRLTASATPEAHWRILGAHHGDELPSGELALAFAARLVAGYGQEPALTALLDRDAVWVVPHVNPDGVERVSRYNAAKVDLNRNYGYAWSEHAYRAGAVPFSEPETRAVRGLSTWNPFTAGLSLHAGASNLGWVWNHTTTPPPDSDLVSSMAEVYAHQCPAPEFWITNGAEWYITNGDTNDWSYGRQGTLDFTLEVSVDKAPDHSVLTEIVDDHLDAMVSFLQWPHRISGAVVDAQTGRGVPATLVLDDGQPSVTGQQGHFARLVPDAAQVNGRVYAAGYAPQEVTLHPGGEGAHIALQPASLGHQRSDPVIVSQGGPGRFVLDADTVILQRPGEADVVAHGDGTSWEISLTGLTPGAWDLVVDGRTTPRGIFIGEVDDTVRIEAIDLRGSTLRLTGPGMGQGHAVVALWGTDRATIPLQSWTDLHDTLVVDVASVVDRIEAVDLVVWSQGYQVAVHDVFGTQEVDFSPPPSVPFSNDTGQAEDAPLDGKAAVGCRSAGGPATLALTLAGLTLARTRRQRA